jgi:hypothetical protein
MATVRVPAVMSLSTAGWITDPGRMLDQLLSDFCVAEKSQSVWYQDNIASLPYLVQQKGNRPDELVSLVTSALQNHISPHYQGLEINVKWEPMPNEVKENTRYNLIVEISALLNGVRVNLAESFEVNNTTFSRIQKANNG